MSDDHVVLTSEELDFIKEMMNIGAGNAATALEQMMELKTDMKIPQVKRYPSRDFEEIYSLIGKPTQPVVCVSMNLVGQLKGKIAFVVADNDLAKLISLVERATPGGRNVHTDIDLSVIAEIGNVIAGTYLSSIHDFCMLNIYHSLPEVKTEQLKTLLQGLLPKEDPQHSQIILVVNEFITPSNRISTYVFLVPDGDSMKRIAQSLRQAKDKLSVP